MGPACGWHKFALPQAGGVAAHAQATAECQVRALIKPGCGVSPWIPGRRLYEWIAASAPPSQLPLCRRRHMSRCRQRRPAVALGATTPYREASSGGGGVSVHQGCHMALRERGRPPVLGTVGAPAPQSCLVVKTCRASWAQGRGWGWGGSVSFQGTNTQHRGRGAQQKPPSLFPGPQRGASPRPAPPLCGG